MIIQTYAATPYTSTTAVLLNEVSLYAELNHYLIVSILKFTTTSMVMQVLGWLYFPAKTSTECTSIDS